MEEAGKKVEAGAGEEEETGLLGGVAVLDFDMLCANVALQTQGGYSLPKLGAADHDDRVAAGEFVGVQRMWEGDVCDCFLDRRIALQTFWMWGGSPSLIFHPTGNPKLPTSLLTSEPTCLGEVPDDTNSGQLRTGRHIERRIRTGR